MTVVSCSSTGHGMMEVGWSGRGENQEPVEVCCSSVLLASLSLSSLLMWAEKPGRVKEAFRLHLGHFRWVLFKGSFALLEHPRTTGCSLSKWLLNTYSVAAYISRRCSSLVTQRKGPDSITPHSFLQLIHFFFFIREL